MGIVKDSRTDLKKWQNGFEENKLDAHFGFTYRPWIVAAGQ